MAKSASWSMKELRQALRLKRKGVTSANIALVLGKTVPAIEAKLKCYGKGAVTVPSVGCGETPVNAAQGQIRRNAACARDLTGAICGDPPIGYSALDRKCIS
jgi:hypothetical protein